MGLDTVELIHNLEVHFAIRIPNKEVAESSSVKEVYEMVLRHLPNDIDQQMVYDDIIKIIADQAGYEIHEIEPHQNLTDDLGLD